MYKTSLCKSNGHGVTLYRRQPMANEALHALKLHFDHAPPRAHLRWNPLVGEWQAYVDRAKSGGAQLPPLPPASSASEGSSGELSLLPPASYDIAVFDHLKPLLAMEAAAAPETIVPVRPAKGVCEVVALAPGESLSSPSQLSLDLWELLLDVWADRSVDLASKAGIHYVLPLVNYRRDLWSADDFGQIFAYPFVPSQPTREREQARYFYQHEGQVLLSRLVEREIESQQRILTMAEEACAFVPVSARHPYETWIVPRRAASSLVMLERSERRALAAALRTVLAAYDALAFNSYVVLLHQAPSDGGAHPELHLRIEVTPTSQAHPGASIWAASEMASGFGIYDGLPEAHAAELRAAVERLA